MPTTRAPITSKVIKAILSTTAIKVPAVSDSAVTPTDATCQKAVATLVADGQSDSDDADDPAGDIFDLCPGIASLNRALTPYLSSDPDEQDDLDQLDQSVVEFCTDTDNGFAICASLTP